ncbi:imidazole glycerol phosphate synthase subunit HisH [Pseudoroseicyclus aestuarii]|uniref:Imidazole glycerol phosphate synthase subunit HisH n=1 Tax=Pseudoroseicyclus aestuarii TaxID=1795041 RepID=A0A318T105_9RHOB|nr:imidazole glycerol phosphate synthase subunit HisH [Pseudoroseicyclus aestuarii]PYE85667.1 imidazole glycerol phosphate synthase subunit HisH [Pseudoroseicyclus aestuarii]
MSLTALIDVGAGNLHSAQKAFERMAREGDAGTILVTDRPEDIRRADRIVLPGDGAFPACRRALADLPGLEEALREAVEREAKPLLGICVGMQLLADEGEEYEGAPGLGWIGGRITRIRPADPALKVPHMGWNDLVIEHPHPVLEGIETGDHAYFVHSYQFAVSDTGQRLASCDYGGAVSAVVGAGTVVGSQFHPEKSQATGLRLIANFLRWRP